MGEKMGAPIETLATQAFLHSRAPSRDSQFQASQTPPDSRALLFWQYRMVAAPKPHRNGHFGHRYISVSSGCVGCWWVMENKIKLAWRRRHKDSRAVGKKRVILSLMLPWFLVIRELWTASRLCKKEKGGSSSANACCVHHHHHLSGTKATMRLSHTDDTRSITRKKKKEKKKASDTVQLQHFQAFAH